MEGRDGEILEWEVEDHGGDDGHSMARATGMVTAFVLKRGWKIHKCCLLEFMHPKH